MLRNPTISQRALWAGGQPISDLMHRALANPGLVSLAAGFVDSGSLPVDACDQALRAVWASNPNAALQYGTNPGDPELRHGILNRVGVQDGQTAGASGIENVIVTAGSNQLLHLVADSLMDPGDIVICSSPTYLVFLGTVANHGARAIGLQSDHDGPIPEALEDCFIGLQRQGELGRVKMVYLVDYFDNPRGITVSTERKTKLLEIVKRYSRDHHRITIVEDVAYRDLNYSGRDLPSLWSLDESHDTVVLAGTFSKSFSPGLRVGWGIVPDFLIDPICQMKGNLDFGSPNLNQAIMAKVLELDLLDSHISRICSVYRRRLQAMIASAREHLGPLGHANWHEPEGGLYVWVSLAEDLDTGPDGRLFKQAVQEGVLYVPGQFCYPSSGQPIRRNTMRLSFGVQGEDSIREGVAALARAVKAVT